jgi:hypothetical protein
MAATLINLEPVSYQVVKPTEESTYYVINPFDLNGNVLSQIVVEVDVENVEGVYVVLPSISSIGTSNNIQITATAVNGGAKMYIITSGSDTISGANEVQPNNPLVTYTCRIATPNQWTLYSPTVRTRG